MKNFNHSTPRVIIGSSFLGIGYGFAAISTELSRMSLIEIAVPILCSAALFACAASALCRYIEVWQIIRQSDEPTVQCQEVDLSKLTSDREIPRQPVELTLRYNGLHRQK